MQKKNSNDILSNALQIGGEIVGGALKAGADILGGIAGR